MVLVLGIRLWSSLGTIVMLTIGTDPVLTLTSVGVDSSQVALQSD